MIGNAMHGSVVHPKYFSLIGREYGASGTARRHTETQQRHTETPRRPIMENSSKMTRPIDGIDDDTNPLFISAVRIFLDFVRDKQGIVCPEKTCNLDDLIRYLGEFQDEARTKKGEKYSPSTIRVIRYSLNRVIALGRNQQEMKPYPTQSTGVRKKRKLEDDSTGKPDDQRESGLASRRHTLSNSTGADSSIQMRDRCGSFPDPSSDQFTNSNSTVYNSTKNSSQALPMKPIQHGVEIFRHWLSDQGNSPFFETFHEEQINEQLVNFVRYSKNKLGKEYSRNSVQTFRAAITQFLKQHNGIDISRDAVFEPTREAFRRVLQSCTAENKTLTDGFSSFSGTEWLGIPVECIKDLYRSGALSVSTAVTLQKKVWLELTIFFRGIPCCPDQTFWNKNTFKISSGDHGVKYVELNPDMYNRYACTIDRISEQSNRIMVQRTSSPYCPVASFELYLQALDPSCDSLFVQPLRPSVDSEAEYHRSGLSPELIRYSSESLTSVHLSAMMETIAQAAKLPFHFTCLSAAETDHVAWMRALTALELELQCQALQFGFPPGGATLESTTRSVASSSPESVNCQRTSVIQAAPRASLCEIEAVRHSPIRSPDSLAISSLRDASPPHRPHAPSATHRRQDNMSPEAIDLVWRKKMKLDHCSMSTAAQPKDRSATEVCVQPHSSTVSHHAGEPALQRSSLEGATSSQKAVVPSGSGQSSPTTSKEFLRENSSQDTNMSGDDGSLTTEEIKSLYVSGVFDPDSAQTLQNKILFELNLHFARIVPFPKKTKLWNKSFFQILNNSDAKRCIDLGAASTEAKSSRIFARQNGSKNCPVSAFEKYSTLLPSSSRMLFPKIRVGSSSAPPTEWYSPDPCDIQDVDAFLAQITKTAKFPKILTQEKLNDVTLKNWSDALDQLENPISPKQNDDAAGPSGEKCGNSNNRPTVKRILELYRMSKSDLKNEDAAEVNNSTPVVKNSVDLSSENSSLLEKKRKTEKIQEISSLEKSQKKTPLILVRPQIVIVKNSDTARLDRAELKQMISDALARAIASPEWEQQIEDAITSAQGGDVKLEKDIPYGSEASKVSFLNSSSEFYKKGFSSSEENQKTVIRTKSNFFGDQRGTNQTKGTFPKNDNRFYDDTASNSSIDSDEHVLRIAEVSDEMESGAGTFSSEKGEDSGVASDEAHGSQRRKAFLPIKHSD